MDISALRIYGAAPSLLERVVPSCQAAAPVSPTSSPIMSTSKVDEDFDMMGYALPPGTIVSTQSWSMHRSPELFPSPETFLPERWMSVDNSELEEERLTRCVCRYFPLYS